MTALNFAQIRWGCSSVIAGMNFSSPEMARHVKVIHVVHFPVS